MMKQIKNKKVTKINNPIIKEETFEMKEEKLLEIDDTFEMKDQTNIEEPIVEPVIEPTIHDKYRNFINMANSGYLHGYNYAELMEILRYTEKVIGHQLGLNMQCPSCLIDLVRMFARFENKNKK